MSHSYKATWILACLHVSLELMLMCHGRPRWGEAFDGVFSCSLMASRGSTILIRGVWLKKVLTDCVLGHSKPFLLLHRLLGFNGVQERCLQKDTDLKGLFSAVNTNKPQMSDCDTRWMKEKQERQRWKSENEITREGQGWTKTTIFSDLSQMF